MFDNDFKMFFGIAGFTVIMIILIVVLIRINKKNIKSKFEDITNEEKREMENIVNKVIQKSKYQLMKQPSNKSEMIQFKNRAIRTYYSIVNDSLTQYVENSKFGKAETSESVVNVLFQLLNSKLNNTRKPKQAQADSANQIKDHYMLITNVKEYAIKNNHSLKSDNLMFRFWDLFKSVLFYCDKNYSAANLYDYNSFAEFELSFENMLHIAYKETHKCIFNHKEDLLMLDQRIMCQNTFVR